MELVVGTCSTKKEAEQLAAKAALEKEAKDALVQIERKKYAEEAEKNITSIGEFKTWLIGKAEYMKTSRPTAVNLMWACEQQINIIKSSILL